MKYMSTRNAKGYWPHIWNTLCRAVDFAKRTVRRVYSAVLHALHYTRYMLLHDLRYGLAPVTRVRIVGVRGQYQFVPRFIPEYRRFGIWWGFKAKRRLFFGRPLSYGHRAGAMLCLNNRVGVPFSVDWVYSPASFYNMQG